MSTSTVKTHKANGRKTGGRKKASTKGALSLPPAISTIEIEGKRYLLTPEADMAEWLEDLEDIVDSVEAMRDASDAIPWEEAKKALGLAGVQRRRTPAKSKVRK